jgi:hypothetical protein
MYGTSSKAVVEYAMERIANAQVRVALPGVDGAAVALVLGDLGVAEGVVDVVAEGAADHGSRRARAAPGAGISAACGCAASRSRSLRS